MRNNSRKKKEEKGIEIKRRKITRNYPYRKRERKRKEKTKLMSTESNSI